MVNMKRKCFVFKDFNNKKLFEIYTNIEKKVIKCRVLGEFIDLEIDFETLTYFLSLINIKSLIEYTEWLNENYPCHSIKKHKRKHQEFNYCDDLITNLFDVYQCEKCGVLISGKDLEVEVRNDNGFYLSHGISPSCCPNCKRMIEKVTLNFKYK